MKQTHETETYPPMGKLWKPKVRPPEITFQPSAINAELVGRWEDARASDGLDLKNCDRPDNSASLAANAEYWERLTRKR